MGLFRKPHKNEEPVYTINGLIPINTDSKNISLHITGDNYVLTGHITKNIIIDGKNVNEICMSITFDEDKTFEQYEITNNVNKIIRHIINITCISNEDINLFCEVTYVIQDFPDKSNLFHVYFYDMNYLRGAPFKILGKTNDFVRITRLKIDQIKDVKRSNITLTMSYTDKDYNFFNDIIYAENQVFFDDEMRENYNKNIQTH